VLVACASPARHAATQRETCDDAEQQRIVHRTEQGQVVIEVEGTSLCQDSHPAPRVTQLAQIQLPASPSSCPIGKLAMRSWDRREVKEILPAFTATLSRESSAELHDAMMRFAPIVEAFVIDCPSSGNADWLLVTPRSDAGEARAELFIRNELAVGQQHPAVRLPGRVVATPPPTQPTQRKQGDCTEAIEQKGEGFVGRRISTSTMAGPSRQKTYALARAGDKATLVIHEKSAKKLDATWRCEQSTMLQGTVSKRGGALLLHLSDGSGTFELTCTQRHRTVAPATAIRVSVPSTNEGCQAHRWKPAPNVARSVLECTTTPGAWWSEDPLFLANVPGVEHVTFDEDDCGDPAAALRAMPSDGRIAPVQVLH